MEKNQIRQLLAKYFEGASSLDEERILKEFFSGPDDVDPELRSLKLQFGLFRQAQAHSETKPDLESEILRKIGEYEKLVNPPEIKRSIARYLIAAALFLAVVLSGIIMLRSGNKEISDTYRDPVLAYAETQRALLFVSQKMNQGMKPLDNISKISTGSQQLKNLEKIDKSLGMLNLVSFVNQSSNLKK